MLRSALPIFSTKSRNKFYGRSIFRFPSLQRNHPKVPTTTSPNQTNHTNTINPKSPSIPQKTSSHIPLSRKFTQLTKRTTIIPKFPGLNGCRTLDPQRKKALLKPHQIPDQVAAGGGNAFSSFSHVRLPKGEGGWCWWFFPIKRAADLKYEGNGISFIHWYFKVVQGQVGENKGFVPCCLFPMGNCIDFLEMWHRFLPFPGLPHWIWHPCCDKVWYSSSPSHRFEKFENFNWVWDDFNTKPGDHHTIPLFRKIPSASRHGVIVYLH